MDRSNSLRRDVANVGVLTLAISVLWLLLMAAHFADYLIGAYLHGIEVSLANAFMRLLVSTGLSVAITPVLIYLLRVARVRERLRTTAWLYFIAVVLAVAILRVCIGDVAGAVVESRAMTWPHLKTSLLVTTHSHTVYVAIAGAVILLYDNAQADLDRERLRAALTASRLQQLRAQFRPHFLLNTLNTIATLVHRDPKTADDLVTSLGTLLRWTLDLDDVTEIELREELDFVRHYLRIQQVRFGERLQATIDAPESALRCSVLPLVLQPLVENAVIHGLANAPASGRLRITARVDGDALVMQVRDSGSADPATIRRGTGLRNVEERLAAMYGADGTLSFRTEANELVAEVRIPARERTR